MATMRFWIRKDLQFHPMSVKVPPFNQNNNKNQIQQTNTTFLLGHRQEKGNQTCQNLQLPLKLMLLQIVKTISIKIHKLKSKNQSKYMVCVFYYLQLPMGTGCCRICDTQKEERANLEKTFDITAEMVFPSMHFIFSNEHAQKLETADCVIVNASKKHPENQFYFSHLHKKDIEKIKQLILKDDPGQVEVMTNPIQSLKVKDIILIHLPVWGQPQSEACLVKAINNAFQEAKKRNHKKVIFTEFQDERGIPLNVLSRMAIDGIAKYKDSFQRIVFNVSDLSKKQYLMQQINQYKEQAPTRNNSLGSSLSK